MNTVTAKYLFVSDIYMTTDNIVTHLKVLNSTNLLKSGIEVNAIHH